MNKSINKILIFVTITVIIINAVSFIDAFLYLEVKYLDLKIGNIIAFISNFILFLLCVFDKNIQRAEPRLGVMLALVLILIDYFYGGIVMILHLINHRNFK